MNIIFNQIISSLQKFSCQDDNRSSSISYFSILNLRELNENFGGRMCYLKQFKNSGSIIGNGNISNIVNQHFIQALRA